MGMKARRMLALALTVCMAALLGGCRTRTGGAAQGNGLTRTEAGTGTDGTRQDTAGPGHSGGEVPPGEESTDTAEGEEPGGREKENPEALRKKYDENAPAEIVPGTDRMIYGEGAGDGAPVPRADAGTSAVRLNDGAEETALMTAAAEQADEKGVDGDAEAAESAMTYYTVLLRERTGSLFECQRLNLYWETEQDHVTVHKSSGEHRLILDAGCYDVSARLLPENLRVDDGWVARKNPGVIVRIVGSGILGNGAAGTGAAGAVYDSLRNREGWTGIDAVRNGRIVLLSRELLEAPWLRTAAAVIIARTAYPSLFSDTDPDEALRMLAKEAAGTHPAGICWYAGP